MRFDLTKEKVQYVVAGSHLDTQWHWTIQQTVDEYLVRTMLDNFDLFEQFPDFVLCFEGAYRYMLVKAHYPDEYAMYHLLSTIGSWVLVASLLLMIVNLLLSFRNGSRAEDNPWGGATLEWRTRTPPPVLNFDGEPDLSRGPYEYPTEVES